MRVEMQLLAAAHGLTQARSDIVDGPAQSIYYLWVGLGHDIIDYGWLGLVKDGPLCDELRWDNPLWPIVSRLISAHHGMDHSMMGYYGPAHPDSQTGPAQPTYRVANGMGWFVLFLPWDTLAHDRPA
ncbi:hypothetical protein TorRG33x02_095050 [Trema orientale]|uniref:Uncharacterized protein n=1 Tax=Trema orientale TaxID=63057 RepID=A0A2P5FAB6_TREOI|nr:hypothetical protein TorRG33x02_095050 [Trema orientale]